jgi:hypothetical protein
MGNIGISTFEGISSGATQFLGNTPLYNTGLLFARERGISNKPVLISSLSEDRLKFGEVSPTAYGAYIVRNLFKNAGAYGATVYGVRILDEANSTAAFGFLTDGNVGSPVNILKVFAGQTGNKDKGTWANCSSSVTPEGVYCEFLPKDHVNGTKNAYTVRVYYKQVLRETWVGATWASLTTTVNESSSYIYVEPQTAATQQGNTPPAVITGVSKVILTGGTYTAPTEAMFYAGGDSLAPLGLNCFNTVDIQMLAVCEHTSLTMNTKGIEYANAHPKKPIFVGCLPYQSNTTTVESFATALQKDTTQCSALYNFWVKTNDENSGTIWVPAMGVIIGAGYIRIPSANSNLIHFPPGGIDSAFTDVIDVTPSTLDVTTETTWVKRYSINIARYLANTGWFLFSSRTTSVNLLYQSVHIRRMTSKYSAVLESNMLKYVQKPVTNEIQREIYTALLTYFRNEWTLGALNNTIPFDKACVINIAPDVSDPKQLNVTLDLIYTECIESIRINLNRNDFSLTITN